MEIWQSLILGIVQGITEWLPISSSGHLVLFSELFGLTPPLAFNVLLHFSTLLVLLVFYYKDLWRIIVSWLKRDVKSVDFKLGLYLIIGTIPIAIVGLFLNDVIANAFHSLLFVGIALLITSAILFATKLKWNTKKELNLPLSIAVGFAQMFAIFPGVSRSGITIGSSLMLGIEKKEAARYSFMLAIPAILGATVLEGGKIIGSGLGVWPVVIGMLSSFVVGYVSLKWLLGVISRNGFWKFGFYTTILGIVIIVVSLI